MSKKPVHTRFPDSDGDEGVGFSHTASSNEVVPSDWPLFVEETLSDKGADALEAILRALKPGEELVIRRCDPLMDGSLHITQSAPRQWFITDQWDPNIPLTNATDQCSINTQCRVCDDIIPKCGDIVCPRCRW